MIDRAVPADSVERTLPAVLWFMAWLVVGAGAVLAMLAALTIGVFILPLCIVAMVVLATRRGSSQGLPGLVSGLSLPLFYVAYLNRDGPGTICTRSVSSVSCTDEWSPGRGSRWARFSYSVACCCSTSLRSSAPARASCAPAPTASLDGE